ncbi:MAG: ferritin [Spirochaetes bacterium]|nr:ferritin [Spirochaetota bacterium]
MLSAKLSEELNKQINEEIYSAYLYFSMAAYFHAENFSGFARWMEVQAMEELTHAKKFFDYIIERGGKVTLSAIEKPQGEWKSAIDAFEAAYAHEQHVTKRINHLMEIAIAEKDYATIAMLQWFVTEQVEEEATASGIVAKLKMVSGTNGIFYLDKELGTRTFEEHNH